MSEYLNAAKEELTKDRERDFGGIDKGMDGWQGEAAIQLLDFVHDLYDGTDILLDRIDTLQMILRARQHRRRRPRHSTTSTSARSG